MRQDHMEHEERTPPPSPYSFTDACITPVPQSPSLSGELIPHPKALHKTLTLPGHGFPKILSPSSRPVPTARLPPTIPANPGLLICTAVPCTDGISPQQLLDRVQLLGAFQYKNLCFWRAPSRNPSSSSQVKPTSKPERGEEAHGAAMALLQDM